MKTTVLVDNHTYIDQYYLGEPAVCYYIEIDGNRILFDTGYSDIFLTNAEKMKINLGDLTHIVFSHGHNDHTGGMKYLVEEFDLSSVELIAHPLCLERKRYENEEIGAPFTADAFGNRCKLKTTNKPYKISENCIFLGEIPAKNNFENREVIGEYLEGDIWKDDLSMDDSAIACRTKDGIFIITGCSHSGICNITEYAKEVWKTDKIAGILGGFHLCKPNRQLEKTLDYLKEENIEILYPCHCVSFKVRAKMDQVLNIQEVGVGLEIEL